MILNNTTVRRQDRLLDEQTAQHLLSTAEFATISMVEMRGDTPAGYGIPVSFAWDGNNHIYIHCAPDGHKTTCLQQNSNHVTLSIVGATNVIPGKFTTAYQSLVIRCTTDQITAPTQKLQALQLILQKYTPTHLQKGLQYAQNSLHRTAILRLTITSISGKAKVVHSEG